MENCSVCRQPPKAKPPQLTTNTFQDMYDKELSVEMSKRNSMGFADMIVKQLSQKTTPPNPIET